MRININNYKDVFRAGRASVESMELKGYELQRNFFVDSSGFGQEGEPALTADQFERAVLSYLQEHPGQYTAKLTSVGQFQVNVGLFTKTGKNRSKRIANNTLLVDYGEGKRAVRLHDTDILTEEAGQITLNSGGWQTVTTKERLNRYLPSGKYISQKNFEWTLHDQEAGESIPFNDGMTVRGTLNV